MSYSDAQERQLTAPWIRFEHCSAWDELLPQGYRRRYSRGEVIKRPGDPVEEVCLLREGSVKVVAVGRSGLQRTLWLMAPDSLLGEAALYDGKPYLHYIEALTDCTMIVFSAETMRTEIVPHHPDLVFFILSNLAHKSYIMSTQLEETLFLDAYTRVAKFLYAAASERLTHRENGSGVTITLSHTDIGELLGLHRVTVSHAIARMRREGILDPTTHAVILRDVAALKRVLINVVD